MDCRNSKLLDGTTNLSITVSSVTASNSYVPSIKAITGTSEYHDILKEFPGITRPPGTPRQVRHDTVHYINTTPGPPVYCRPRRLAPDRLKIAKAEFDAMVRDGTCRYSSGPWASALHLVP